MNGKHLRNQLTMISGWTRRALSRHDQTMVISALALALGTQATVAHAAGVSGVDVNDSQIVISFDGPVEKASSLILASPARIAVDIVGADPGGAVNADAQIAKVRQGRFDGTTARIVFDLAQRVVIGSGTFSPDGRALSLSLASVSPPGFEAASAQPRKTYLPPEANRAAPPRSRYNITVPIDPPGRSNLPRPRILGPKGRPLIVIDAGHGGHDPGAISPFGGKREKDITLGVARSIQNELLAGGRFRVALTREDDRFLVLRERSAIARNIGADLFISIHADSAGGQVSEATGATVYTLSEVASDREAAQLAQRENKSDIINGVNLGGENAEIASILVDLAQRESMNTATNFANLLKRESSQPLRMRSDFHRTAGFAVLKSPDMPSVLLEIGYLTNSSDISRLSSSEGQKQIAEGIRRAADIHFAQRMARR
jgi:N-acetylmuramoyl-L-alanine amidase